MPTCFLFRLDISHYVSFIIGWKIFTSVHPKVKIFYIMCVLTRTTDITDLQQIVRAAIILCSSENVAKDKNQQDTLAEKSRILLCDKIREVPDILNIFNDLHLKIQFIIEIGGDKLNFLNVTIIKVDNRLEFDWFHKPTFSGRYLNSSCLFTLLPKKEV